MSDTFVSGVSLVRSDEIPPPPEPGFIRVFAKADGSVWQIDSSGTVTRVTNG